MNQLSRNLKNDRGAVSILFILTLFSIFAVAGTVIDLGLARTTQAIMQNAADGSAVTGLRLRDGDGISENDRRSAVAINAARNFSHQVQGDTVSFSNDDRVLGAGPIIDLDEGIGDVRAGQLITLPENNQYLPELELNLGNSEHGDMVSGNYDLSAIHTADALANPFYDETSDYERAGFTPDALQPYQGNAFLVRLRRTPDRDGLDNQEGISSSGPPLPFLFARGAAIKYDESYDVGGEGLTVRAAAIALARPAKTVGASQVGIKGVTPFILSRAFWDGFTIAEGSDSNNFALEVQPGGLITNPDSGAVVGRFIYADENNAEPVSVGMIPGAAIAPANESAVSVDGYVPVTDALDGNERIIGFGRVEMTLNNPGGGTPYTVTLTKFVSRVADENASASFYNGLSGLDTATIEFLVASNQTEGERFSDPLLAPALVR